MGTHEVHQPPESPEKRSIWGVLRFILKQPRLFVLGLLGFLIAGILLASEIQKWYGQGWGQFAAIVIVPILGTCILKTRMRRRGRLELVLHGRSTSPGEGDGEAGRALEGGLRGSRVFQWV